MFTEWTQTRGTLCNIRHLYHDIMLSDMFEILLEVISLLNQSWFYLIFMTKNHTTGWVRLGACKNSKVKLFLNCNILAYR